ncbi:MAG TPA: hypothetical protein VF765_37605 [Polyangiaceae bacterium]
MTSETGKVLALACMALGVPAAACGGRFISDSSHDAGAGAPTGTGTQGTGTTTAAGGSGTGSSTATGGSAGPTATGSATSTASGSASGSSSSDPFGSLPCEAYTTWNYSCPPSAGTAGCTWAYPQDGNPSDGWTYSNTQSEASDCQLEIIAPNGDGTCSKFTHCLCAGSKWVPEPDAWYPCPR